MKNVIPAIQEKIPVRRIQTLCRQLIQSGGLNATKDYTRVDELATWLYLYGYMDEALQVCDLFAQEPFQDYVRWNPIDHALCLKVRILRERGQTDSCEAILKTVNAHRAFELYDNFADWFLNTLEEDIQYYKSLKKSTRVRDLQMLKLEMAIAYKEAGQFPVSDEVLESIIADLTSTLLKSKKTGSA